MHVHQYSLILLYAFIVYRDPDPFELLSFQFERPPCCDDTTEEKDNKVIDIQIRGYKKNADEVWQSTGLTLWRASDYLCQYQMENMQLFQNGKILELGAGLGLNGILAWKSTSSPNSEVCITDGDSEALVHLRENVERNRIADGDGNNNAGKVSCHQLIWGKESSIKFLDNVANNQRYDVILASDIIYSPVIVQPLWETVETLLKKPRSDDEEGGVFIMSYARRKVDVSIELVLEKAVEYGFVYKLVKEDEEDGIWVYTFRFREEKRP